MRGESKNADESVNTGLNTIANDPGLTLPKDKELMNPGEFGSVYDQIEESARQLNVYFTNLQIDGAEPTTPDSLTRIPPLPVQDQDQAQTHAQELPGGGEPAAAADGSDPSSAPGTIPQTGVDQQNKDDPGVHISLLESSGDGGAVKAEEPIGVDSAGLEPMDSSSEPPLSVRPEGAMDPQARKRALASELATILAELASTSDDPGSAALALASIETLLPDDTDALLDDGVLSDAERESVEAVRSFLGSMSSEGTIASPAQVSAKLDEIRAQLDQWAGLSITRALLCTKVNGYGRYETFPSYRFVAGRAQSVVVYVELERFAQREFTGPDGQARYETKVSQRLELYHASDDLNTWNRAAETVSDETRNRLRDYYLTNTVTLPANLGVGRYHLKVVMRDLIGDRVAETIIPIEIVSR